MSGFAYGGAQYDGATWGPATDTLADATQALALGQGDSRLERSLDDATQALVLNKGRVATGFAYGGAQYDETNWGPTADQPDIDTLYHELGDATQPLELSQGQATVAGQGDVTLDDATHDLLLGQGRDSIGFTDWVVSNQTLRVVGATLTPTELSIDVRSRTQAERDALDTLDAEAGAVDTRERADGTVDGLDRAGGNNTFTVYPPVDLQPPRINREWVVDDVERDRASADTQSTLATVTFVGQETRDPATGLSESGGADAWTFHFDGFGTIATPAVSGLEQGEVTALTITMTPTQAELFETTAAATAGAVASEVPDGETFTRDTTPDGRQTVTITPPAGASDPTPSSGEYVVTGWESVGSSGGAYRVTVEISSRYEPR